MKVRVHHPGTPGVVAPGGPFPLVVFLHGQQIFSIPGFEGYDYLGTLLASHGFIVASIDGRSLLDSTIKSRGEHVREHLRRFVTRNMPGSGSFLSGKLDLSKVTVVGHSRGGDAVVATWEWQRVDSDLGYTIAAIIAIAPVQFFGRIGAEPSFISHARDVAYQILHGAHDCDVSDFQGLRQYDRAAHILAIGSTPKSMVYIRDANHNFFNTVWETFEGSDCGGLPVLSGPVARDLAKVYIHAFLQVVIKGNAAFRGYLTGEVFNPVEGTEVLLDFQAPGPQFIPIDHFEDDPHDKFFNSQGGMVDFTSLTHEEVFFSAFSPFPFSTYPGETFGAQMRWTRAASYRTDVPLGAAPDPTVFTHLSFRVAQIVGGILGPQIDFLVRARDRAGNVSLPTRASYFGSIPVRFDSLEGGDKTVMGVVRIPLSWFAGDNNFPGFRIDDTAIAEIEFLFDEVIPGEIVVDDIRFTK